MAPRVIIIGGGMGGMATAIYARRNGYDVDLFEMNSKLGGLVTTWKRGDYKFDGCLHHFCGAETFSSFHKIWVELGIPFDADKWVFPPDLIQVVSPNAQPLTIFTDLDKFEAHIEADFKHVSQHDRCILLEFCQAARRMAGRDIIGSTIMGGIWKKIKTLLPLLRIFLKYSKNLEEIAAKFEDPDLRRQFPHIMYDWSGMPAIMPLFFLQGCSCHDYCWPVGGSDALTGALSKIIEELGVNVHLSSKVERIIVENNVARGIVLVDGTEHRGDWIVSNADGYCTIYKMLEEKYIDERIRDFYDRMPEEQEMDTTLYVGVKRDLSSEAHAVALILDKPIIVGKKEISSLYIQNFASDPTYSAPNTTAFQVSVATGYKHWERDDVKAEKKALSDAIIDAIDRDLWHGLKDDVEVADLAIPQTRDTFVGIRKGMQVWQEGMPNLKGFSIELPGLDKFLMIGQFGVGTIGHVTMAALARKWVGHMCRVDGRQFVSE